MPYAGGIRSEREGTDAGEGAPRRSEAQRKAPCSSEKEENVCCCLA